jgi:hypothetical protein
MRLRTGILIALLVAFGLVSVPASTRYMPIDEVQPGMVGTGRTVFSGEEPEEFTAHVLGVLQNVMGPRRNLILARLEGGPLAHTGVIAGMSGSPVYIDGRLVGAVSYSLGAFSKEPIAGITPIAEMTEITWPERRPGIPVHARLELPVTQESLIQVLRHAFARVQPFAERSADVLSLGLPAGSAAQMGLMLRPIATPLVLGGFDAEVFDFVSGAFQTQGFMPVVAGAGHGNTTRTAAPLRPGDAVGVSLISGDLALAGTGTVTHVDGSRVYAFGHPFYNLGPTEFPMTRAYIQTLLPSLFSSVKIAAVGEVIGTFQQDRATAIAGTLGRGPNLIPISISLEADRGLKKDFTFEVVNDQLFTPLLTYVSILSTLRSYEREFGAATFTVTGRARVKGHDPIAFEDIFTGESPSVGAATYVAAPITFLLRNDFEPVEIEGVEVAISSMEQPRTATLERVWLDEVRPRAGRTVNVKVLTRTYRGEERIRTVPIDIPANATGALSLLVADGAQLAQIERRELRPGTEAQSLNQMIRALNRARKNNRLYVKLLSAEPGAVVKGEALSQLPPSVLAVFEADRSGGHVVPLRSATIGDWEIVTDHAVSGSRRLTINIDSD